MARIEHQPAEVLDAEFEEVAEPDENGDFIPY